MGALLAIDPSHPTPLYAQLEQGIRAAVATGRLAAGAQLPTVRQLAVDLRVNANTVARVYLDLERAGVLEARRGVGTFVAARAAAGTPPKRSPRDPELTALVRRWRDEAAARGFQPSDVLRALKRLTETEGA